MIGVEFHFGLVLCCIIYNQLKNYTYKTIDDLYYCIQYTYRNGVKKNIF